MASPPRTPEREEERRSNTRTLVIASAASASAALVVSQLWIAGTWIAAAVTPVLVAFFSELLHRPTQRITRGLTSDRPALAQPPESEAPVRIYRAGSTDAARTRPTAATRTRRRKIAYGAVFGTAAIALAIAVAVLTIPELVAGQSIGSNSGRTTFFGGGGKKKSSKQEQTPTNTSTTQTQTQSTTSTQGSTPTQTNTSPSSTTPTTPSTTAPTPTTTTP